DAAPARRVAWTGRVEGPGDGDGANLWLIARVANAGHRPQEPVPRRDGERGRLLDEGGPHLVLARLHRYTHREVALDRRTRRRDVGVGVGVLGRRPWRRGAAAARLTPLANREHLRASAVERDLERVLIV